MGIAKQGPFLINCAGGTKKVLWTFFARALKSKSEVEIKLFELLISVLLPISPNLRYGRLGRGCRLLGCRRYPFGLSRS